MIDEFAYLIAKHEMGDTKIEIYKGELIPLYHRHEYLLNQSDFFIICYKEVYHDFTCYYQMY